MLPTRNPTLNPTHLKGVAARDQQVQHHTHGPRINRLCVIWRQALLLPLLLALLLGLLLLLLLAVLRLAMLLLLLLHL
jgi:hypothetical protein